MSFSTTVVNGRQRLSAPEEKQTLAAHAAPAQIIPPAGLNEQDFKRKVINDLLGHLDYQSAEQNGVVEVRKEEIAQELERLSARTLIAWYEAFLLVRSEMMYGGDELNGLRIIDHPADILRKLMKSDPEFDIQQYIF
ncbi:MAG: hypothetical protein AAB354_09825 [candidate division KSB1 bacterium]